MNHPCVMLRMVIVMVVVVIVMDFNKSLYILELFSNAIYISVCHEFCQALSHRL